MKIQERKMYWASFNSFEFRMTGKEINACSHSGPCDNDVNIHLPQILKRIKKDNFPNKPTPEKIKSELKSVGTWNHKERRNIQNNWKRLIWIAACNIQDEYSK